MGDQTFGCDSFAWRGWALKNHPIDAANGIFRMDALGEGVCKIEGEAMIHQREGLQRRRCVRSLRRGERDVGKVKVGEDIDHAGTGILMIHGAAIGRK